MKEEQTYAEQMMRMVRERQQKNEENLFNHVNNIDDGYVIIQYEKLKLSKRELVDGKITMTFPEEFQDMDDEAIKVKYPEEDRPRYIYCNQETTVSFNFNIEEEQVKNEEIEEVKDILKRQIMRLYSISKAEMDELIQTEQGKTVGVFAIEIPVLDGTLFQISYFMSTKGGLLIGGFNCDADEKKEWSPVVKQLLTTIEEQ